MTCTPTWNAAAIDKTAALLAQTRPAYASLLRFYGPVFSAQARAIEKMSPKRIDVDKAALRIRQKEGFALIEPASFTIDLPSAQKLLGKICDLSMTVGENLGMAGKVLSLTMAEGVNLKPLFKDVLGGKERIQALAKEKDVPPNLLTVLLYLAIRPSVVGLAGQLADCLEENSNRRSSCPICGSAPILGELDANGGLWMHCSLCWHRWHGDRMVCLFCGHRNNDALEYLYSEKEPEYWVYLCGACLQYLKVVDTRQLQRMFIPPLEQVVSLHLDMLVTEKGYSHPLTETGVF